MPYSADGAVGAGIMAGVAAILAFYATFSVFPRQVRFNPFLFLGLTVPRLRSMPLVYLLGIAFYLALCILFALGYAGLYQAFDVETDIFAWGVLFGLGHWVIDGFALGAAVRRHGGVGSGLLIDPGAFALNLPWLGVLAFLAVHLLFGMFVGAFYDALR